MKRGQKIVTWLLALVLMFNTLALGKIEVQAEEPEVQAEESAAQVEESEVQTEESEVQVEEPEAQVVEPETQVEESEVQAEKNGYHQLIGIDLGEPEEVAETAQEVPKYNRYQATKWDTYSSNYFVDQLSSAKRQLYNDIYNTCMAYLTTTSDAVSYDTDTGFTANIAVPAGLTESDLKQVICLVATNNPQFYFINEYYGYTSDYSIVRLGMYPEWVSGAARANATNQVSAKIDSWLAIIQQEGTPLAKEKKAHDLVVGNTKYETANYNQSCAGVFLEGKAVCAGYAETFELLCNGAGINTISVTSESHEWNLVQMYGRWYNVDCTWDDQDESIYYNYFNVSDATVNEGAHVIESVWSNFQIPTCSTSSWLNISGIYVEENANGIRAGAVHETSESDTQYRWLAYDVNKGTWETVSNWNKSEWVTWKPRKGNYWLRVEAKTGNGLESNYTVAYNPSKNYAGKYVDITGIYCVEKSNGIQAGAVHEKDDANTVFRWMVYDVNKGTWTVISNWQKSEWVTWKPKKGNYWLRVEAKTSDGNESNYTIAYNPTKSYISQYVDINGIYCVEGSDGIRAGAVHEKNDSNTKFRWLVYDVNKGTWTVISNWQKSEWVTWKPKKGNYWLRVEAKTSGGDESNYTVAYNPSKNYAGKYVEITGIYCQEQSGGIRAGAVHEKNDSNTKFRWLVYDVNKGTWTVISNWQKSEWVTWKPNKGNYWLRVEAKTSDGDTSDYTIAYNVNK